MNVSELPPIPPKNMRGELRLWDDTFQQAVEVMSKVVPYPARFIKCGDDERAALLEMVAAVTEIAARAKEGQKVESVATEGSERKCKVERRRQAPDKMPEVTKRMDRLEGLLVEQINEQRKILNKPALKRKRC